MRMEAAKPNEELQMSPSVAEINLALIAALSLTSQLIRMLLFTRPSTCSDEGQAAATSVPPPSSVHLPLRPHTTFDGLGSSSIKSGYPICGRPLGSVLVRSKLPVRPHWFRDRMPPQAPERRSIGRDHQTLSLIFLGSCLLSPIGKKAEIEPVSARDCAQFPTGSTHLLHCNGLKPYSS